MKTAVFEVVVPCSLIVADDEDSIRLGGTRTQNPAIFAIRFVNFHRGDKLNTITRDSERKLRVGLLITGAITAFVCTLKWNGGHYNAGSTHLAGAATGWNLLALSFAAADKATSCDAWERNNVSRHRTHLQGNNRACVELRCKLRGSRLDWRTFQWPLHIYKHLKETFALLISFFVYSSSCCLCNE